MAKKHSDEKEFLQTTIDAWQPISPVPLTEADAAEILAQMLSLTETLKKIDEESKMPLTKIKEDAKTCS